MVCGSSSSSSNILHILPALHHRQSSAGLQATLPPTCGRSGPTALLCAARPLLISPPQVKKLNDCIGDEVKQAVADAKEGEVCLTKPGVSRWLFGLPALHAVRAH